MKYLVSSFQAHAPYPGKPAPDVSSNINMMTFEMYITLGARCHISFYIARPLHRLPTVTSSPTSNGF
jgi:hypothetical protein